jgi:hypothetical protein
MATVLHVKFATVATAATPIGWPISCKEAEEGDVLTAGYDAVMTPQDIEVLVANLSSSIVEPIPVPQSVTKAQARIALRHAGLLDDVEAGLNALPAGLREDALDAWEHAPIVSRTGALVTSLGQSFGLSAATLDALFIAASAIEL